MMLLVGLGNPGQKYANNRHNIGFMAVDEIIRRHGLSGPRFRFQGEIYDGTIGSTRVLALKPLTFMNDSGQAVGEAMRFYKLEPEQVIVFYDEMDLEAGKLKVKTGGGTAGHNGIKSVTRHIGAEFTRVRMGVGHPGQKHQVLSYVLKDFAKSDHEWLEPLIDAIAEHVVLLIEEDMSRFMTKVHLTRFPEDKKPAGEPKQKKTDRDDT